MLHVTTGHIANAEADAHIPELMHVLSDVLIGYADVLPVGGIRTRALRPNQYRMADGAEDNAFIHATFRIKAGRRKVVTGPICVAMFAAMRVHPADVFACRYLGLTLELMEFGVYGFHVENNVYACFARAAEP